MMLLGIIAAAAVVQAPSSARPVVVSSVSISALVESCGQKPTDMAEGLCTGYILGMLDAMSIARRICPSQTNTTSLQAVAVSRKYLLDHPEQWDASPSWLVGKALSSTFPC